MTASDRPEPRLGTLPDDPLNIILDFMPAEDVVNMSYVCKKFQSLILGGRKRLLRNIREMPGNINHLSDEEVTGEKLLKEFRFRACQCLFGIDYVADNRELVFDGSKIDTRASIFTPEATLSTGIFMCIVPIDSAKIHLLRRSVANGGVNGASRVFDGTFAVEGTIELNLPPKDWKPPKIYLVVASGTTITMLYQIVPRRKRDWRPSVFQFCTFDLSSKGTLEFRTVYQPGERIPISMAIHASKFAILWANSRERGHEIIDLYHLEPDTLIRKCIVHTPLPHRHTEEILHRLVYPTQIAFFRDGQGIEIYADKEVAPYWLPRSTQEYNTLNDSQLHQSNADAPTWLERQFYSSLCTYVPPEESSSEIQTGDRNSQNQHVTTQLAYGFVHPNPTPDSRPPDQLVLFKGPHPHTTVTCQKARTIERILPVELDPSMHILLQGWERDRSALTGRDRVMLNSDKTRLACALDCEILVWALDPKAICGIGEMGRYIRDSWPLDDSREFACLFPLRLEVRKEAKSRDEIRAEARNKHVKIDGFKNGKVRKFGWSAEDRNTLFVLTNQGIEIWYFGARAAQRREMQDLSLESSITYDIYD